MDEREKTPQSVKLRKPDDRYSQVEAEEPERGIQRQMRREELQTM